MSCRTYQAEFCLVSRMSVAHTTHRHTLKIILALLVMLVAAAAAAAAAVVAVCQHTL